MAIPEKLEWKISDVREETHDTKTLVLTPLEDGPVYIAGQCLTVELPGFMPPEGKSYSLSSAPHDGEFSITIKLMGTFSRTLLSKIPGDTLITSLPYGDFYPKCEKARPLSLIAGGIGISPCYSIVRSALDRGCARNIDLFYSNKTQRDIIFRLALDELQKNSSNFKTHYFITREEKVPPYMHQGRINASRLREVSGAEDTDFFICGSNGFIRDMWRALRDNGVPSVHIYTEGFF
jgi:ferredoxin-NADP reductase